MQDQRAHNAISSAAVTLFVFIGATACFLPPLNKHIVGSMMLVALIGMTVCISFFLHLIFVGIAARRLARNVALWVIVCLCFFPIGSIIGLILFEWFSDESRDQSVASS